MSTRGQEKTGKIADARQAVENARQKVENMRADLFNAGGNFEDKARVFNCALVDLARKVERFEVLKKRSEAVRDDRNIVCVFRSDRNKIALNKTV